MLAAMCIDYSEYKGFEGIGVVLYTLSEKLVKFIRVLHDTSTKEASKNIKWNNIRHIRKTLEFMLLGPHRKTHKRKAIDYLASVSNRFEKEQENTRVATIFALTPRSERIRSLVNNIVNVEGTKQIILIHEYLQNKSKEAWVIGYIEKELRKLKIENLRRLVGRNHLISICDITARYAAIRTAIIRERVIKEGRIFEKEHNEEGLISNKVKKEAEILYTLLRIISKNNLIELLP